MAIHNKKKRDQIMVTRGRGYASGDWDGQGKVETSSCDKQQTQVIYKYDEYNED